MAVISNLALNFTNEGLQMTSAIVQGLVRHLITAIGGALLLKYGVDGAGVDAIAGACATIVGVLWSVRDKVKAA